MDEAIISSLCANMKYGSRASSTDTEKSLSVKSFSAFEYYISNRPLPALFGTFFIDSSILFAARYNNDDFNQKLIPYINKVKPTVYTYSALAEFYSSLEDRDKVLENLIKAQQYGAKDDFLWVYKGKWAEDVEIQNSAPKCIYDYPLNNN